tara:strand:- start:617 stop:880 length:264 start_codon:yes stop_codon:yes gene_type:complete
MGDPTESFRRAEVARINTAVESSDKDSERVRLEAEYGKVWDTEEMRKDFEVQGFGAPYMSVIRLEDGVRGNLQFQHMPRFYFNFQTH